ncbi:hypothetical protein I7648_04290 [Collinsella tanakaei]|nr:hypothetical protein [Collinsella tanakaei]
MAAMVLVAVHALFSMPAPFPWLRAKWDAGDVLGYCGSILGAIAAISSVVLTLRWENENRREDLQMAIKPLLVLSLPTRPFEMEGWPELFQEERDRLISRFIRTDGCLSLEREKEQNGSYCVRYPSQFSDEQLGRIEEYLNGNVQSLNGMTAITAPVNKCFWRIEMKNVGDGPAINVSVRLERQGAEAEEFRGSPVHSPVMQIPAGECVSLGVYFEDGHPLSEHSELVIRYYDRDMREYRQRAAFVEHVGDNMVKELDFNIDQECLGNRR